LGLLKQRGAGSDTICRALGVEAFCRGKVAEARSYLKTTVRPGSAAATALVGTLTSLDTASSRSGQVPVWRSLPRGFLVGRKYRIEAEVGRGGMASVYRAAGVTRLDQGKVFALKVPAPDLMTDPENRARFEHEIRVSQRLSTEYHP